MNTAIRLAKRLFPGVLVAAAALSASSADAAQRGSAAWCKQMMDKPSAAWSINDQAAFEAHCSRQRTDPTSLVTEDDNKYVDHMFNHGTKPPAGQAAPAHASLQPVSAGGALQTDAEAAAAAQRAADRAKYQHYLDTHPGGGS